MSENFRPNRPKHASLFSEGRGKVVSEVVRPRGPTHEVTETTRSSGAKEVSPKRRRSKKEASVGSSNPSGSRSKKPAGKSANKQSAVSSASGDSGAVDSGGSTVGSLYAAVFSQRGERG